MDEIVRFKQAFDIGLNNIVHISYDGRVLINSKYKDATYAWYPVFNRWVKSGLAEWR